MQKKLDKYGNDMIKEGYTDIYIFFPISDFIMEPMHNIGFKPNYVTFFSTLLTISGIIFFFNNYVFLAIFFYALGYTMDCLDGRMARNYNQESTFGMIADTVSDNISNLPLMIIFLCKTLNSLFFEPYGIIKLFLFLLIIIVTFIFGAVFGINEAIESYEKTKSDNFYNYKIILLKKEKWDETLIGKIFLFIYKQSYNSYRYIIPQKINEETYVVIKKKLLILKEFGPGNYNLFLMIMMYLFCN